MKLFNPRRRTRGRDVVCGLAGKDRDHALDLALGDTARTARHREAAAPGEHLRDEVMQLSHKERFVQAVERRRAPPGEPNP
jgi:hypothetical protein